MNLQPGNFYLIGAGEGDRNRGVSFKAFRRKKRLDCLILNKIAILLVILGNE
jgi:hypothetical protein